MKILLFIITLLTSINLSNDSYLTKEQEFLNNVHNAYSSYYIEELDNATGDLILVVGKVDEKYSFSIFYKSNISNSYNVDIYDLNKDKVYTLSDYEDYQIYYNIQIKNGKSYKLLLKSIKTEKSYMEYDIKIDEEKFVNGLDQNNFPYNTKLKNRMSNFTIYLICIIIFIIVEVFVYLMIRKRKASIKGSNNYNNNYTNNNYQTLNYVVIEDEKVDKDEN